MEYLDHPSGRMLYYEKIGQGRPVIFIHGWGTSSKVWDKQAEYFSKTFTVYFLDLAGHGMSSRSKDGYSFDNMSDDLMFFVNTLKLENYSIVGWSMGGILSIMLFCKQKNKINSIVLVSSTPKFVSAPDWEFGLPALIAKKLKRDIEKNYQSALKTFNNLLFKGEEEAGFYNRYIGDEIIPPEPDVALQTLSELEKEDLRNFLAPIDIPTLILHGELDEICLPKASEFMHKKIKKSVSKYIFGAAHMPFLTHAEKFNTIVMDFLK